LGWGSRELNAQTNQLTHPSHAFPTHHHPPSRHPPRHLTRDSHNSSLRHHSLFTRLPSLRTPTKTTHPTQQPCTCRVSLATQNRSMQSSSLPPIPANGARQKKKSWATSAGVIGARAQVITSTIRHVVAINAREMMCDDTVSLGYPGAVRGNACEATSHICTRGVSHCNMRIRNEFEFDLSTRVSHTTAHRCANARPQKHQ
jgi:hypothetical protein